MITEKEIMLRAEEIQKRCHDTVSAVMAQSTASYQDATNAFIWFELARIELMVIDLGKEMSELFKSKRPEMSGNV